MLTALLLTATATLAAEPPPSPPPLLAIIAPDADEADIERLRTVVGIALTQGTTLLVMAGHTSEKSWESPDDFDARLDGLIADRALRGVHPASLLANATSWDMIWYFGPCEFPAAEGRRGAFVDASRVLAAQWQKGLAKRPWVVCDEAPLGYEWHQACRSGAAQCLGGDLAEVRSQALAIWSPPPPPPSEAELCPLSYPWLACALLVDPPVLDDKTEPDGTEPDGGIEPDDGTKPEEGMEPVPTTPTSGSNPGPGDKPGTTTGPPGGTPPPPPPPPPPWKPILGALLLIGVAVTAWRLLRAPRPTPVQPARRMGELLLLDTVTRSLVLETIRIPLGQTSRNAIPALPCEPLGRLAITAVEVRPVGQRSECLQVDFIVADLTEPQAPPRVETVTTALRLGGEAVFLDLLRVRWSG